MRRGHVLTIIKSGVFKNIALQITQNCSPPHPLGSSGKGGCWVSKISKSITF